MRFWTIREKDWDLRVLLLRRFVSSVGDLYRVVSDTVSSSLTCAAFVVFSGSWLSFFPLVLVVVSMLVCCMVWRLVVSFCDVEVCVVIATEFVTGFGADVSWSVDGVFMTVDSAASRARLWWMEMTGCIVITVAIGVVASSDVSGGGVEVVCCGGFRCGWLHWFVQCCVDEQCWQACFLPGMAIRMCSSLDRGMLRVSVRVKVSVAELWKRIFDTHRVLTSID